MRSVQTGIESVELFRKNNGVAVVGLSDQRNAFQLNEIRRPRKCDPNAVS